jgi:hypothetical protein
MSRSCTQGAFHRVGGRGELLIGRGAVLGEGHPTRELRDDLLALGGSEVGQRGEEGFGATGHGSSVLLLLPPVTMRPRRRPRSG